MTTAEFNNAPMGDITDAIKIGRVLEREANFNRIDRITAQCEKSRNDDTDVHDGCNVDSSFKETI